MKRSRSPRDLWASLLPTAGGVLALAIALRVPALVRGEPMPAWLLVTLLLVVDQSASTRVGSPATKAARSVEVADVEPRVSISPAACQVVPEVN